MAPVDINLAAPHQIMLLRGIGPVHAARIIAGRPFSTNYDLVTRNILSENIYDRIAADLTASPGAWSGSYPAGDSRRVSRGLTLEAAGPARAARIYSNL